MTTCCYYFRWSFWLAVISCFITTTAIAIQIRSIRKERSSDDSDTTVNNRCSLKTFEQCLSMMQDVMDNSSLAFPINSYYLDITCRKLKSGDYCAEKYIRTCAGNRQRHLYQDIVQGSKNVIRLLCQQGQTQQLYLKYAPCYKDISVSSTKCSPVIGRFQKISKMMGTAGGGGGSSTTGSETDRLRQFCCAYRDSVDCQIRFTRRYCGQEGLQFFERYMSEMTNSLINEHCIGYTYSDKCHRSNSTFSTTTIIENDSDHRHHQHQFQFVYFNNSTDQNPFPDTSSSDNSAISTSCFHLTLTVLLIFIMF